MYNFFTLHNQALLCVILNKSPVEINKAKCENVKRILGHHQLRINPRNLLKMRIIMPIMVTLTNRFNKFQDDATDGSLGAFVFHMFFMY